MAQENAEHQNGETKASALLASLKPQVVVPAQKADEAVQFYKAAFGAEEVKRATHPKRKADQETPLILCAELKIGSSALIVCDQTDDSAAAVTKDGAGSGIVFRLETDDLEGAVERALGAGAVMVGEIVEDEAVCGGGLVGTVQDPFGVSWVFASASKKCAESDA